MGSKNHEVVPTPLIQTLSGPKIGTGVHKSISALAKVGLIAKVKNASYDGYRLTYGGLDYLSLNTHRKSGALFSLGNQIGVGKESDIYVVASPEGRKLVLKIHRLGRISFRTVKANRDYLRNRHGGSWMYLSRLAAQKEYAFMQVLRREGFPVPEPVAQSRHTLVMEFIDSFPLRQIEEVADPASLYDELMDLIVRLARVGLIHGDFNEFNILIREEQVQPRDGQEAKPTFDENDATEDEQQQEKPGKLVHGSTKEEQGAGLVKLIPILIDFPQMLSTTHANAKYYFDRDVDCIKRFFAKRFKYETEEEGPHFAEAIKDSDKNVRLDVEVEATGFSRKLAKELDRYIDAVGRTGETEQDNAEDEEYTWVDRDDRVEEDLDEQEIDEGLEKDEQQDEQVDDPKLADEIGSLGLEDNDTQDASKEHDDGLAPVELPKHPEQAVAEKKSRKKKAGWAI